MECGLCKYKIETATHYVGRTGKDYEKDKYHNWGIGERMVYKGKIDLPQDEYPYTLKYNVDYKFRVCREGRCGRLE